MTNDAASRRDPASPDEDPDDLDLPWDDADSDVRPAGPARTEADRAAGAAADGAPATPAATSPKVRSKSAKKGRWWEFPVLAAVAILVAIVVKTFLVQPFYIPSESMEKTLHGCAGCNGDKILVNKVVYHSRDPHPGEIIVFRAPAGWEPESIVPQTNAVSGAIRWFGQLVGVIPPDEKDLVKRVIAVGGQTVRGDADGQVQISDSGENGPWRTLNEPFVYLDGTDGSAKFGPVTVPKGRLWVMGDHRNDSADSRYHCGAALSSCDPISSTVATSSVIGKAFVVAWPVSRWRTLGTPSTFTADASALAGSSLSLVASAMIVAPFWLWRRRKTGS